jgi:hypothetical protein
MRPGFSRASRIGALSVSALLSIATLSARGHAAEEKPAAVLTIQTLDAFENADSFTSALKRALEEAPGWTVAKTDKDYALQVLTISLDCADPPDAVCEQKIGDEIIQDHFLWGRMAKEGDDVTGELHLWSRGKGSTTTKFRYSANVKDAADETLLAQARKHVEELVGAPPGGTVKLRVGAISGTVKLDGEAVGRLIGGRTTIQVPPGAHRITVEAEGYNPMEAQIDMKPLETREVSLVPTVIEPGPDAQKIVGFTLMGLGVVAAGAGVGVMIKTQLINDEFVAAKENPSGLLVINGTPEDGSIDLCKPGDGSDPYPNFDSVGEAQKTQYYEGLCDTGRTMQTLQLVLFPLAGVLAGTGAVLLGTADWSGGDGKESAGLPFRIDPSFGPGGADVRVTVKF